MLSEALVEAEELANAQSGEQKGNGEARGVDREEQNAAGDGVTGCRKRQHGREDGADARRPSEGKGKTEEKPAPNPGLLAAGAQANVAVEPAGHGGAEEPDQREGGEMDVTETGKKRAAAQKWSDAQKCQPAAENEAGADGELYENAGKGQSE